jgi:hypothetical protein
MGALATQPADGKAAKPAPRRKRRLSPKAKELIELVSGGVKPAMAAKVVKLSDRQARRIITRPDVQQLLHDMAVHRVTLAKGMAIDTIIEMAQQRDSKKVALEAAERIAAIGNIRPPPASTAPNVSVNIGFMSPDAVAFYDRTHMTLRTKADRAEFDRLAEKGAFGTGGSGFKGYVVDLSEYEDNHTPPAGEQVRGEP